MNTSRKSLIVVVALSLVACLAVMTAGQPRLSAAGTGPCDIYASGGTPCVAAHSTVRALYGSYNGRLYQVRRSNGQTMDINTLEAGGFADAAAQDSFCSGTSCTITIIYDQSGQGNHLTPSPAGGVCGAASPANATALPLTVGGHNVYGVYISQGIGYRDNTTSGIATGDQPEGMYAVMSGTRYNSGCCFDYGNAETNNLDTGNGHMEAIYLGNSTYWGHGSGSGPWVMADLENGLFAGGTLVNNNNTSVPYSYVTAILKGEPNHFAIRAGNAQSGSLTTMYDGTRPTTSGYNPMHKEGAIILGTGGDNSCSAIGNFYEGAMTSGYPSNATENSVQTNIIAAGYGYSGPTPTPPPPSQNPVHYYTFDGNANDSGSGSVANGTVTGGTYTSGQIGQAINLSGSNQYVSFPTGFVSGLSDFSIATWVQLDTISNWSRVFDFGTGTTVNMFLTPQNGSTGAVRFAITTSGNSSEQQITGSSALPTGQWVHVAVTKSGNTGRLYVNGSQVGSNSSMTLSPSSLGSTNQNWIGRSQYSADPYLDGRVDDFRIYNRALSSSEVSALASGGATPTPTTPPAGPTNTPTATPTAMPTSQPGGLISQAGWSLQYVDSEELSGENGAATNAFDGNTGTIWHTEWYNSDPPLPHEIQINLGASYSVTGFRYLPRQDGNANGRIGQYQFYVSTSPSNWGSAVAAGTFANSSSEKEVTFAAKTGQYVRLVALSEVNGNPWTSAAEINVLGTSTGGPTSTPTNTPAPSSTYQAENASLGGGVSVDTNHSGYNGTGFVNFPTTGGYVEYQNVDGGSGGSRTLVFRFALGASSARTGQLTVNGVTQNITFQPTGSWNSWSTMSVTVTLNPGTSNTIRLQSTGQDLANQDQMTVN